jgi:hypothetical protein
MKREILLFNLFDRQSPPAVIAQWLQQIEGWKYSLHREPNKPSREQLFDIINHVTPEMVERTFRAYSGTVDTVADTINAYYDAGMTLACVADLLPAFLEFDPTASPFAPTLQLCTQLKR